jgi:hypothetical protein
MKHEKRFKGDHGKGMPSMTQNWNKGKCTEGKTLIAQNWNMMLTSLENFHAKH